MMYCTIPECGCSNYDRILNISERGLEARDQCAYRDGIGAELRVEEAMPRSSG